MVKKVLPNDLVVVPRQAGAQLTADVSTIRFYRKSLRRLAFLGLALAPIFAHCVRDLLGLLGCCRLA